jgi:hypothetical protein
MLQGSASFLVSLVSEGLEKAVQKNLGFSLFISAKKVNVFDETIE